jgi:hypothetical protein
MRIARVRERSISCVSEWDCLFAGSVPGVRPELGSDEVCCRKSPLLARPTLLKHLLIVPNCSREERKIVAEGPMADG